MSNPLWRSATEEARRGCPSAPLQSPLAELWTLLCSDTVRLNPARLRRGYLRPGEPLYVRLPADCWRELREISEE